MDEPRATADQLDLEAYLARIGCAPPLAPDLEALRRLHQAHVGAIPFENLDVLLGRPIPLDLASLEAKLVAARRGGYCFEQNTLFAGVLEALGFVLTRLAARVRQGATAVRPRTHMLLRVDLPEGPFLADVGFGGDGPLHPLPLVSGRESWLGGTGHRLRREAEAWVLEGTVEGIWTDLYVFTLEPQHPADYEMANYYTSTHPQSAFRLKLTAQRSWPEARIALRNRELVRRTANGTERITIRDPEHLLEVLDREFGLRFPPGTRFPQPSF